MTPRQTDDRCAETIDLMPAYVLDALKRDDAARVEAHVEVCERCRAQLDGYRSVAERLLLADPVTHGGDVPAIAPVARSSHPDGPAFERRRSDPDRPSAPETGGEVRGVGGQAAPRGLGWAVSLGQRLHEPERRWSITAITATLLLVVALLGSNLYWAVVTSTLRSDGEDLATLAGSQQDALESAATGGTVVLLRGGDTAPAALGTLTVHPGGSTGLLTVDDLPRQPAGSVYQLWLIHDGERDSGGLFTVDGEGRGWLQVDGPTPPGSCEAFGVTLEPKGGSPGPTGETALKSGP